MCELIKNYEEYLNMNYFKNTKDALTSIETLFKCDEFIKSHQSSDIPFYTLFVKDSQLFADFIYKRMIPKDNQEIIDVLFVNDTLTKIKNKNKFFRQEPTDFLDNRAYMKKNKYDVLQYRDLTEKEIDLIMNDIQILNTKGQIIEESNDSISFKYIIFPQLHFDIYFNNDNANEYFLPQDFSEDIEAINNEVISKSYLGQSVNRSLEMINYLYLSWLEVWAFTFRYLDNKEKPYRFNQMIDVLNKVIHHEMNILNLLFDALSRDSQNEMLLKLYRKILDLNINPSFFINDIISSVADKTQMRVLKGKSKVSSMKLDDNELKYKNCNSNEKIKRTFASTEDVLEINQDIKFYSNFACVKCGKKINLLNICKTFSNIRKDELWIPCTCDEYILPKIKVQFGKELLRDKKYKTSTIDEIVIYSPDNLKKNIKSAVMRQYGKDLNVKDFKSQFKPLFWNFIWYCKIHKLDYEIILPYVKDIDNLRKIKYQNKSKEKFEITYEDKYYTENLSKIDRYSKIIYERFVNKSTEKKIHKDDLVINNEINLEFIIDKKKKKIEKNKFEEVKENIDLNKKVNNIFKEKEEEDSKKLIMENIKEEKEENDINIVEEEEEQIENIEEEEIKNEEINNNNNDEHNEEIEEYEEKEEKEESEENKIDENKDEDNNKKIEEEQIEQKSDEIIEDENKLNQEKEENIIEEEPKLEEIINIEEEPKEDNINLGDEYYEDDKEEIRQDNKNNKNNIKDLQSQMILENDNTSSINVELKKIPDLQQSCMDTNPEEINVSLKKLDESVFQKEPKPEKKLNYKLKKIGELSQSKNTNVNSGEDFLAQMKKKLKKVGTNGIK